MVEAHIASGAPATVAAIRQPISMSDQFGVIDVDPTSNGRIREFLEKPTDPTPLADNPDEILASMGNYVFDAKALVEQVTRDADAEDTRHDMGGDIMPAFAARGEADVYDFKDNEVPGAEPRDRDYWRDVGTIDSYYDAHMDLVAVQPIFNLYNYEWPIFTDVGPYPPAKFVHGWHGRVGSAVNSIVSPGLSWSVARSSRTRSWAPGRPSTRGPRSPTASCSTGSRSGGTPSFAGRSSTRTSRSRRTRGSAWTPRRTRPAG